MARPHTAWLLLGPFLLSAAMSHGQTTTVTNPCDPRIVSRPSYPLAYVRRGDRCEGVYLREDAGTGGLSVVAFTTAGKALTVTKGQPIRLEWSAPDGTSITLRAVSLRPSLFYRMDSSRPMTSGRFDWPSDVLTGLELTGAEIGVVAWTRGTISSRAEEIYVPLRVGGAESTGGSAGEYIVTVVPGAALSELFVSLSAVDASGKTGSVVLSDTPLKRGPYPAEYPIPIRLPRLPASGLYRLELNSVLRQGAPSPRSLYFLHTTK